MLMTLFRGVLFAVCALWATGHAAIADDEPPCDYCSTIDINGEFDGHGCALNYSRPPGSECSCIASLNGSLYGIDGYACRKPALPPVPPAPRWKMTFKPNWERLSEGLTRSWSNFKPARSMECSACYYTLAGKEKSCVTAAGTTGSSCACYEEISGKVFPLRLPGKLCQGADGSPR